MTKRSAARSITLTCSTEAPSRYGRLRNYPLSPPRLQTAVCIGIEIANKKEGRPEWNAPLTKKIFSEAKHNAGGWLRNVSDGIGIQSAETEVWSAIDQPAVLRPQRDMPNDRKIGAASVNKNTGRLLLCTGNRTEQIISGIKDQGPALGKNVGTDPEPARCGQAYD